VLRARDGLLVFDTELRVGALLPSPNCLTTGDLLQFLPNRRTQATRI